MPTFAPQNHQSRFRQALYAMLLSIPVTQGFGQSAVLSLPAASSAAAGSVVNVPLVLSSSGDQPAGVQWTMNYSASDITSINVTAGPAATAAGKDVQCRTTTAGATVCLISGLNANAIEDGTVATMAVQLGSSPSSDSIPLLASNAMGVSPSGSAIATAALGTAVAITSPASLGGLSCNAASIAAPSSGVCTVSVGQPAAASGLVVSLTSSNTKLSVPSTVLIPAGATSVTFPVAAATAVTAALDVQISALWTGGSAATLVKLIASGVQLTGISCSPTNVPTYSRTTCTVSVSAPVTANTVVTLNSTHLKLTVPSTVTIPAGASSVSFTATSAYYMANTTARVSGWLNGTNLSTTLNLIASSSPAPSPTLSTVTCNDTSLTSGTSATCSVTTTAAVTADLTVALASNSALVQVPSSVRVPAGSGSASFTATAAASGSGVATLSAVAGGVTKTTQITVTAAAPSPTLSTITCNDTSLTSGASATCSVTTTPAVSTNLAVALTSNSALVQVPSSVLVPAGAASASFTATAAASGSGAATLSAVAGGVTKTAQITVSSTPTGSSTISRVNCPTTAISGTRANCNVILSAAAPAGTTITLASNLATVTVPATVAVATGATSAPFAATVALTAPKNIAKITATLGASTAAANLTLEVIKPVLLSCSPNPLTAGALLTCQANLSATPVVDAMLRITSMAPTVIRAPLTATVLAGTSNVRFVAYSTAGVPTQTVRISSGFSFGSLSVINDVIVVGTAKTTSAASSLALDEHGETEGRASELPVIDSIVNAAALSEAGACSPGSAAIAIGSRLISADSEGVRVDVNGEPVQVLVASPTSVTFECPDLPPGTPLKVVVRSGDHSSNEVQIELAEVSPGIFTIDGVERALGTILVDSTGVLAVTAPGVDGTAARQGDTISILCTGLGRAFGADGELSAKPVVAIGGMVAEVLSVTKIETGVHQVNVRIPETASLGEAVPVEIQMPAIDGQMVSGNKVHISIE